MRATREAAAESRRRIVEQASALMRRRGVEAASVAEVCAAAGLTHGGFYKHFASKDALLAEATSAAFAEAAARFDRRVARKGRPAAVASYVADYLSDAHVAAPERGCPIAAFGADAGRRPNALSTGFTAGVEGLVTRLAETDDARGAAIARMLTMVGAVVAARAVGPGPLQQEILSVAQGVCDVD